jgi:hypothetical protein
MDKSNQLYQPNYEEWKKNLWGATRAFVAGFLSVFAVQLLSIDGDCLTDLDWWLKIVLTSCLVGGFIGLGKFLRDLFPESALMQRIPI